MATLPTQPPGRGLHLVQGFRFFGHDREAMLKAIIFDYGKVLTLPPTADDWARLASVFGVSADALQSPYWDLRLDYDRAIYTANTYWEAVAKELGAGLTRSEISYLVECDNRQWMIENPEMLDLAWRAQEAGLKIAILSNMQRDMLAAMRKRLPWLDRFDVQIYSCEIGAVKPEPASYEAVLKALNIPAGAAIFFDDKQPNIEGARLVGLHAELFAGETATAYDALNALGVTLPAPDLRMNRLS